MEDIFYSSTFAGEVASLAAAKVVLDKVDQLNVPAVLADTGGYLLERLNVLIAELECNHFLKTSGHPSWSFLHISGTGQYTDFEIKTLFMQEMLKRGILTLGTHCISYSHTKENIDQLLQVYKDVIYILKDALDTNSLREQLTCEVLKPLFKLR